MIINGAIDQLIISHSQARVDVLLGLSRNIKQLKFSIVVVSDLDEAMQLLANKHFHIVFLDYHLAANEDNVALIQLTNAYPEIPVLEFGDLQGNDIEQALLLDGAQDYLPLPRITAIGLMRAVCRSLERHRMISESEALKQNVKLLSEVKSVNKQLRLRNEEIMQFYQTISHELKTPLTSIQSFVTILLDQISGEINDEQKDYLQIILKNCQQLSISVNDLLTVASLDTQKMKLYCREISLLSLVRRVVKSFEPIAASGNVRLRLSAEQIPAIYADEMRLAEVLNNLLSNALKYTPEGGQVDISVVYGNESGVVQVLVRDSGVGIDKKHFNRLFDRLYQVDDKNTQGKAGLGLGLHICQQIISMHGGEINVDSELGQGSTFSFILPVTGEDNGEDTCS